MLSKCPEILQTDVLEQQVEGIRGACLERLAEQAADSRKLLEKWLLPVCSVSPYITQTLTRYPDILPTLIRQGSLQSHVAGESDLPTSEQLCIELDQFRKYGPECSVHSGLDGSSAQTRTTTTSVDMGSLDTQALEALEQRVLRVFRHQNMIRILWCELTGLYTLEQTLQQLSTLAQACVVAAEQWSHEELCLRFGTPCDANNREQRLIIVGMGKLGGDELNVSSDIDIICLYPASGQTRSTSSPSSHASWQVTSNASANTVTTKESLVKNPGVGRTKRSKLLENSDFFRRLVQRVCKLLHSITEDGFVYRVDTRLRPFGESGPPVMSLAGLESYYLTQARDWERYAMIKGRAITGHPDDIKDFEQLVTPFVYRRYLDYNAFESLRDLKRKIALSLVQNSMRDNIKLGAGGIREIEFIGQAFQLVRGGQDRRLRIRPILKVLKVLNQLELLQPSEVEELVNAYRYLRRVENAVQMMRDEQVHCLPEDPQDRERLLCMLDQSNWDSFQITLQGHQSAVSQCFGQLFEVDECFSQAPGLNAKVPIDQARDLWAAMESDSINDEQRQRLLDQSGFPASDVLLANIVTLTRGSFYQRLAAESQQRIERLVPNVLVFAGDCDAPGITLSRMLQLIKAVAGRSGYLQVLIDQPMALQHLVVLFSKSSWLAEFVASQPIVIDELLTNVSLHPDAASVCRETNEMVARLQASELDVQMDALRRYRQARQMRIACAQLDGSLGVMQVSDQLTWLAESIIAGVIQLVSTPLIERFGTPEFTNDAKARKQSHVGVLAYGKLGGVELGFGSDLDLVFVHDSEGLSQVTNGTKSIENSVFYAKLAQKFVHFMNTRTPAGILYDIDLRLRPNGSSGVLVTGMYAYAKYQDSDAWTWEHQALIRARLVYGHPALQEQFLTIRQRVLANKRALDELKLSVANMRERMRLANGSNASGMMDLKQDSGGVADIEFIVQYLVLAHSSEHPELLLFTDNIRILQQVETLQLLPAVDCQTLQSSYLALRDRLHRLALDEEPALVYKDASLETLAGQVSSLRHSIIGGAQVKTT